MNCNVSTMQSDKMFVGQKQSWRTTKNCGSMTETQRGELASHRSAHHSSHRPPFATPCTYKTSSAFHLLFFIGTESDHWLCLSVTHSLTHSLTDSLTPSCLVNLIDVTLACEDANSKLVEVVTDADVTDEDHVGNSLFQICQLRFGHNAKLLFFSTRFGQDFNAEVQARF